MTDTDRVKRLFTEANPIPEADSFVLKEIDVPTYLASLEQRSSGMTQLKTRKTEPSKAGPRWNRLATVVAAVVVFALAIVLFAQDDGAAPVATEPTPSAPAPLTITAVDYGFEGVPAVVKEGTELRLLNNSSSEFHEMAIVRLDEGDSRSLDELRALSAEELNEELGYFQSVALAMPGEEQYKIEIGTTVLFRPGRYLIFCAVPLESDPAEIRAQVETGPPVQVEGVEPHYKLGQIAEFIVVP